MKFSDINKFLVCQFVFKSLIDLTIPIDYFQLTGNNDAYILRNVINLNLSVPFMNSTQSHSSPSTSTSMDVMNGIEHHYLLLNIILNDFILRIIGINNNLSIENIN